VKPKHAASERLNAQETLKSLRIPLGADFHTLSRDTVEALLVEADRVRYQKPPRANGSRARYFHDLLQRRARQRA
jgi:hypothetical protein